MATSQPKGYITRYTPAAYKAGPVITHTIQDHRDILYFASNKGILEYDGSEFRIIQASNFSDIKYIRQADDGTIYIGANNDFGLLASDSTGNLFFKSLLPYAKKPLGEINEIWQIEFYGNKVYFQSNYGGVSVWDGEEVKNIPSRRTYIFNMDNKLYGSKYKPYEFGYFGDDGSIQPIEGYEKFNKDVVYKTFAFGNNKHLLMTADNGLFWFDAKKEKIEVFDCEASTYLKKYWFFDGIRIDNQTMALGTWEGGVILINNNGEILEIIDEKSGLLANKVNHMVLGANHDLWLGTSDGIAKIDLDSLSIPLEFESNENAPTIIRSIKENETKSVYNRPFGLSNHDIEDTVITLSELPTTLTFQYAVPSLAGHEMVFQSKLEGFDKDWNEWTSSYKKDYTGISNRGKYTFKVKGKDEFGAETSEASILVFIDIPWYETPLKYLLAIPAVLLLVFGFIKIRTNQHKKTRLSLEKIIADRTSELIKKQVNLELVNQELKTSNHELDSFVYHTSHDLKAPLKSIIGLIKLSEKEEIINENIRTYLQMIEKSVLKLEEFIYSIVEYSMNAKGALRNEKIEMDKIVDEVFEELKEFSHLKEINITKQIDIHNGFVSDPVRIKNNNQQPCHECC